jgi:hypothetical protein
MSSTTPTASASTLSAGRLVWMICSFMGSTSKRRVPAGSGRESGPDVGFGRSASPITLASSVAATVETSLRSRPITRPDPGHDRTGDATAIGAQ